MEHWYIVRFPGKPRPDSPRYIVASGIGVKDFDPSSGIEVVQDYGSEAEADLNCERLNNAKSGTRWVALGEGSTWLELEIAFGFMPRVYRHRLAHRNLFELCGEHTTLKLTGSPIQAIDRERWESGNVR